MPRIYGNDADNQIVGSSGMDTIHALGGDDEVWAGQGADVVYGGTGQDYLNGGDGNDRLEGDDGNDILIGGAGADWLIGGEGDDVIGEAVHDFANDQYSGGNGDDTITVSWGDSAEGNDGNNALIIAAHTDLDTGLATQTERFFDFTGGNFGDVESFMGGGYGGFTRFGIITGNGNDTLVGSGGNDTIQSGGGIDLVSMGTGDDVYDETGGGADTITGGIGRDHFNFRNGSQSSAPNLITDFTPSDDSLQLDNRMYNLTVTLADVDNDGVTDDTLVQYSVYTQASRFIGLLDTDATTPDLDGSSFLVGSANVNDSINAGTGRDHIWGLSGNDILDGGLGDDVIDGGAGDDSLLGRDGNDVLRSETGWDTLVGGAGNDTLYGGTDFSTLFGGVGDDLLVGHYDGDNYLIGGEGADTLAGAGLTAGYAHASYQDSSMGMTLNLVDQSQSTGDAIGDVYFHIYSFTATNFADIIIADDSSIRVHGNDGNDTIYGTTGATYLFGDYGNDYIVIGDNSTGGGFGGSGNDLIIGGASSNTLYGDDGKDTILGGDANDRISGHIPNPDYLRDAPIGDDDFLYGEAGNDTLDGGFGSDLLYGGDGADTLIGDIGNDQLNGGAGADVLNGNGQAPFYLYAYSYDFVRYDYGPTGVFIDLLNSNGYQGDAQGDTFISIEGAITGDFDDGIWGNDADNYFVGNGGNDYLDGRIGSDALLGGNGADTLVGGAGGDYLEGAFGADIFRYLSTNDATVTTMDYLADFSSSGGDKIDLSAITLGTATFNSGWGAAKSVYAFDYVNYSLVQLYSGSTLQMQMVVNQGNLTAGDFVL